MPNSRDLALRVLQRCHRQGAWVDEALRQELAGGGLDSRDAALASRLAYGVVQNQLLLDYYLAHFCNIPLEKLSPRVLDILRLGAAQLLLFDRIPPMAAVNESVKLAKKGGSPKTAGLVNAVLRNLDRSRNALPELPTDPLERISVRYSHPLWLVKEFADTLGAEETEALLQANNAATPMTAQVNTLKCTLEDAQTALRRDGAIPSATPFPGCLALENTGNLEKLPSFQQGLFYIQDPAARETVLAACPKPGETVLDLCAAPGGKTFAAAIEMGDSGHIFSQDIYPHKVKTLAASAARLGFSSVHTRVADARMPVGEAADLVIADVPCSGLGIIRKKPDIRYKDPVGFGELLPIQRDILENAAAATRPGGRLLYATCTLRKEENEGQVDDFLARHKEFTLKTAVTRWPHRDGTDGFFYALLMREACP